MCNCEGCILRFNCELEPDFKLEDVMACEQIKNAEILQMSESFYDQSFFEFKLEEKHGGVING